MCLAAMPEPVVHRATDLVTLFRDTFFERHHTVLEGGFEEPVYLAGTPVAGHIQRSIFVFRA